MASTREVFSTEYVSANAEEALSGMRNLFGRVSCLPKIELCDSAEESAEDPLAELARIFQSLEAE
ncbi:MAG: hypothetical protein K2W82_11590 [Candidatus Obscuribacterales bacterium]|jgi:hypothetical protein|nr:hypothetical protein [Candidatus Obscuribacterales bacterium]